MIFFKIVLYPFSIIYGIITSFRNFLYDHGYKASAHFPVKTICVGNLSVGGTGKTPFVEYLVEKLNKEFSIFTLSRGYGRKSKGFKIANDSSSVDDLGDESYQYYTKFKNLINVSVGESRVNAIQKILKFKPKLDLIILDDAFQHRALKCDFNILLTDYNNIFYKDLLLPAGRLREKKTGVKRAEVVIVSKCPANIEENTIKSISSKIKKITKRPIDVFFTTIRYGEPINLLDNYFNVFSNNIFLVTGIAKPKYLEEFIIEKYNLIGKLDFSDHHNYTKADIVKIKNSFIACNNPSKCIITTEKDMVKFQNADFKKILHDIPVFYIPITAQFLKNQARFDELILNLMLKKIK